MTREERKKKRQELQDQRLKKYEKQKERQDGIALTLTLWAAKAWYDPSDPEGFQRMFDTFSEVHQEIDEFVWEEYWRSECWNAGEEELIKLFQQFMGEESE
ncbi:MAG: hypothetical protein CMQ41_07640 [Gammaproteobacteria bacterium]|nr:hypothetical protein [Gammaproteobacteria bacterium]|tara:strand:- start:888 stop:1190 length:303 start_codon:yes stop_codon:yes gene_type:complete